MSKLAYLHSEGVTDLHSYFVGVTDEQERIIAIITAHANAAWCGEGNCPQPFPLDHLIEIIKSEQ